MFCQSLRWAAAANFKPGWVAARRTCATWPHMRHVTAGGEVGRDKDQGVHLVKYTYFFGPRPARRSKSG